MDKAEAKERFDRANEHYRSGEYAEALVELDALEAGFPDNIGVLEARARTLEHLGRYEEAMVLFDRLLDEFNHEKVRSRRERVAGVLGRAEDVVDAEPVEAQPSVRKRRFRIKPVRLIILVALVAGMYFDYVPEWLGIGLIVAYFAVKYAIKAAFIRLLTIPFKLKGKALAGATAQVHGFEWTDAPPPREGEDDDEDAGQEKRPLRYVWIDVTITPPVRTEGFTHWEPGELALAPSTFKYRRPDDMDKCFQVREVRLVRDGHEEDDEGYKYAGPQRIKVLAGVPPDQDRFRFAYYFEIFGDVDLRR